MTKLTTANLSTALVEGGILARDFENAWEQFWQQDHIPPIILDICRLRLAGLHGAAAEAASLCPGGCGAEMNDALQAGTYHRDSRFSAAEIAAIEFTEVYAQDPASITDDLAARIKERFGEPGLVCLIEALGFIDARIRLSLMFEQLAASPRR